MDSVVLFDEIVLALYCENNRVKKVFLQSNFFRKKRAYANND